MDSIPLTPESPRLPGIYLYHPVNANDIVDDESFRCVVVRQSALLGLCAIVRSIEGRQVAEFFTVPVAQMAGLWAGPIHLKPEIPWLPEAYRSIDTVPAKGPDIQQIADSVRRYQGEER